MSPKKSNPRGTISGGGWAGVLRANGPVLVALVALWPAGWIVEHSGWVDRYSQRMITLIGINIILAVSLQLINGISGQFSLGHAGFMAVGAYTSAYCAQWLATGGELAWYSFVLLLVGGGMMAALAGLAVGIPTLRLRGDYLAIATLGFAEIIAIVIINSEPLGGALGMRGIPDYGGLAWIYGVGLITVVVVWRLVRSARGRALLAVREDEIAAAAIGISATRAKVLAFVVGAFFAGVAGALFAHSETFITPRHFSFMRSIELVVMVTLAGSGSISGTVLAAIVLTYLPEFLRDLPEPFRKLSELRMVIYSLILILLMLLRPEGILGRRELWWTRRAKTRKVAAS